MEEKVYNYLIGYGFTHEQIDYIEDNNENIYMVTTYHVDKIIEFLKKYNLKKIEIIRAITDCPEILSQKKYNLDNIIKIFDEHSIPYEKVSEILKTNPKIFAINYKELKNGFDKYLNIQ